MQTRHTHEKNILSEAKTPKYTVYKKEDKRQYIM